MKQRSKCKQISDQYMNVSVIPANRLSPNQLKAWSDLQRADGAVDSPFFCPEFTLATARVCDNVEVAVLTESDEPVGFFPFQRERRGVGRAVAWRMSDMHGVIARQGLDFSATQLVRECGLAAWHFDHLVASQRPFEGHHLCVEDSPYIDLADGYEAYSVGRRRNGSSVISQTSRKARNLTRDVGPLRFEMHVIDGDAFRTLLSWKQEQVRSMGGVDVFDCPWVVELLDTIRSTETEAFSGMLSALYAGDHLVAVHLGMRSYGVIESWVPAYNPNYAKYSPGLILNLELAKSAAESGVTRINLGRGYNQTKRSLMSGAIPVALGTVDRRPVKRLLRSGWYRTRAAVYASPLARRLLPVYRRVSTLVMSN